MRQEVAMLLVFLFVPVFVLGLAYRSWRTERPGSWPPPPSLVVSLGVVLALLGGIWWSVTSA